MGKYKCKNANINNETYTTRKHKKLMLSICNAKTDNPVKAHPPNFAAKHVIEWCILKISNNKKKPFVTYHDKTR